MKNEVIHEMLSANNKRVLLTFSSEFPLSQDKVIETSKSSKIKEKGTWLAGVFLPRFDLGRN